MQDRNVKLHAMRSRLRPVSLERLRCQQPRFNLLCEMEPVDAHNCTIFSEPKTRASNNAAALMSFHFNPGGHKTIALNFPALLFINLSWDYPDPLWINPLKPLARLEPFKFGSKRPQIPQNSHPLLTDVHSGSSTIKTVTFVRYYLTDSVLFLIS